MRSLNKYIKRLSLASGLLAVFYFGIFLLFVNLIESENVITVDEKIVLAESDYVTPQNQLPETSETKRLSFLWFGDVMLDRHVREKIDRYGLDYILAGLASTTNPLLPGAYDMIGANLEGAVTVAGAHYPPVMEYDFAFATATVAEFKNYGFNFFNLANNHLTDQGNRGIMETAENLAGLGFDFSGCHDGEAGECSVKKLEVRNKKVGLVGFSVVYGSTKLADMEKIVLETASTTDLVVLNMHWGVEYDHAANERQKELARRLIDAGADIIIGHHPHVVQGIEIYQDKPIFYSLGNFIFDQYFSADTQEGLAIGINWEESEMEVFLYPHKSFAGQVRLMAGEEKENFFSKLISWSMVDNDFKTQIKNGTLKIKY